MSANDSQIDGDHYSRFGDVQPWDMPMYFTVDANIHSAYCYLVRMEIKGQADSDFAKIGHYIDKLLEYYPEETAPRRAVTLGHSVELSVFVGMLDAGVRRAVGTLLLQGDILSAAAVYKVWAQTR